MEHVLSLKILEQIGADNPTVLVLLILLMFMGWLWKLERKDKKDIIKSFSALLVEERNRADSAHQMRTADMEKFIGIAHNLNIAITVLTERIRKDGE